MQGQAVKTHKGYKAFWEGETEVQSMLRLLEKTQNSDLRC